MQVELGNDSLFGMDGETLKHALEALLLVCVDPVSSSDLARSVGVAPGEVASALAELSSEYEEQGRGIQLREVAGGWRLYTHPAFHEVVERHVLSWDTRKLTQAALETLAVIAYHQPVTRDGVRGIRGVNSDGVISSLVDKGLVRELGRSKAHGQAILYGTTSAFLEKFGLASLKELPPLEDFAPDEESRQFIRERLSARPAWPSQEDDVDENQLALDLADDGTAPAPEPVPHVDNPFFGAASAARTHEALAPAQGAPSRARTLSDASAGAVDALLDDVYATDDDGDAW